MRGGKKLPILLAPGAIGATRPGAGGASSAPSGRGEAAPGCTAGWTPPPAEMPNQAAPQLVV